MAVKRLLPNLPETAFAPEGDLEGIIHITVDLTDADQRERAIALAAALGEIAPEDAGIGFEFVQLLDGRYALVPAEHIPGGKYAIEEPIT